MLEVYAHEHPPKVIGPSIFLAGPSPRGQQDYNWRPTALRCLTDLKFRGTVYIPLPRDGNWLPDYDAQVIWELLYLEEALSIVFWVSRSENLPGFTTNVEFGLFLKSQKIVLGYPHGAKKMRYLDSVARMNGIEVFHDLEATLEAGILLAQKKSIVPHLDINRFRKMYPDGRASIPRGYSAPLDRRTTRELIRERVERAKTD